MFIMNLQNVTFPKLISSKFLLVVFWELLIVFQGIQINNTAFEI